MTILLVHPGASWAVHDVYVGLKHGLEAAGATVIPFALDVRLQREQEWLMFVQKQSPAGTPVLAAALLHDYLEDVPDPGGPATIRTAVGDEVLRLVLEVTEEKRPDLDSSATWPLRKNEQLQKMAGNSEGAVLIKAADLLHNLLCLLVDLDEAGDQEAVWLRLNVGPDRQLWYFSGGLDAARQRLGSHLLVRARTGGRAAARAGRQPGAHQTMRGASPAVTAP